ncbi:hypothetical protein ACM6PT_47235, partial [Klebsiella pneumoniae]
VEIEWWRGFDEPALESLIQRALAANLDIALAGARLDELDYWQAQLHDAPHALPCENPHGALENRHERRLVLSLDAE